MIEERCQTQEAWLELPVVCRIVLRSRFFSIRGFDA
jgi:hypothetical protein